MRHLSKKSSICTLVDTRVRIQPVTLATWENPPKRTRRHITTPLCSNTQGLTQERLGLMIGTGHSRISNIERGRVVPSVPDMIKLCRALEADPVELVDTAAFKLSDFPERQQGHARLYAPPPRPAEATAGPPGSSVCE